MPTFAELQRAILGLESDADFSPIATILNNSPELLGPLDSNEDYHSFLCWLIGTKDTEQNITVNREALLEFLLTSYAIDSKLLECALLESVITEQEELVELLLENGVHVDGERRSDKWTPLQSACVHNYTDIAELLLKHDADIHIKDSEGNTLFHLAFRECPDDDPSDLFDLLIAVPGCHILLLKENKRGETPFQLVLENDKISIEQKKQLIERVLLENPSLEMPPVVSQNSDMSPYWELCVTKVNAIQGKLIDAGIALHLYNLLTSTHPTAFSNEIFNKIDVDSLKKVVINVLVENGFQRYQDILSFNLDNLTFIKTLKTYKLGDSNYCLCDLLEKNEHQLAVIFSNPKIEKNVKIYLENDSDTVSSSYQNHLENTLKKNIEAGLKLLHAKNVDELDRLSTQITQEKSAENIRISEAKAIPSTSKDSSSFFKRALSDSDSDSEEKPQKIPRQAAKNS